LLCRCRRLTTRRESGFSHPRVNSSIVRNAFEPQKSGLSMNTCPACSKTVDSPIRSSVRIAGSVCIRERRQRAPLRPAAGQRLVDRGCCRDRHRGIVMLSICLGGPMLFLFRFWAAPAMMPPATAPVSSTVSFRRHRLQAALFRRSKFPSKARRQRLPKTKPRRNSHKPDISLTAGVSGMIVGVTAPRSNRMNTASPCCRLGVEELTRRRSPGHR